MASEELTTIIEGIFSEEQPEREEEVESPDEFCSMVAEWVSKLKGLTNDDAMISGRSLSIIGQAMERDAISEILDEGLEEDPDSDQVSLYIEAFGELKEMAGELHAAFPRTYPMPAASVGMRV